MLVKKKDASLSILLTLDVAMKLIFFYQITMREMSY